MKKATPLLVFVVLFTLILLFVYEVFTNPAMAATQCRVVWVIKRHHGRPVRWHHRIVRVRRVECSAIRVTHPVKAPVKAPAHVAQAVSAKPVPSIIEVGNVPGCVFGSTDPQPYLDTYHATVLRIIVTEGRVGENPLPCIEMAVSEGFHVHVALQWDNHDTPSHVAAYISSELNAYGSLLWAVSLGNEQELAQGGVGATARQYADDWQAAEPVVANLAPNAIRVAGDISPWALSWIEQAWTDGLPGAQALGAHPYQEPPYAFTPGQFLGFAQATGLPAWFDEGLAGPHAWDPGEVLYASAMSGAQLAGVWWDGTKLG